MSIAVGDRAPSFIVETTEGFRTLDELIARGSLVLVFYVEDGTPACTAQLCAFRDEAETLAELGAQVLGVSTDDLRTHHAFAAHAALSFPLAADVDLALARAYGVLDDSARRSRRAVFVIGRDGAVKAAVVPFQPAVGEQFQAVFEALGIGA
jgi:peroxiredoxin Q/BCP